ncbi:MAG: hypothetical protein NTV86_00365 [Planctomycetota bacterium]|nr:hypothetical protein [Planctomycetota bacterium]
MAYRDVSVVLKEVRVTFRVEEGVEVDDVMSCLDIRSGHSDAEVVNSEVGDWHVADSK